MKKQNTMKLQLDSRSVNESFARSAVAGFVAQLDPTLDELADIKTAVSEAVTNCTVHAYPGTLGKVYITVKLFGDGVVSITVADKGVGIEDVKKAREPLFTTGDKAERSGLGFAVMESFMNTLKVYSAPGKGTRVLMSKKLAERG